MKACADCDAEGSGVGMYLVDVPFNRRDQYARSPFFLCAKCWDSMCNVTAMSRLS